MDNSIPQNITQCAFNFDALNAQPFEQITRDTSCIVETSHTKKQCSSCRAFKPKDHEHFGKESRAKDGFRKDCKECRKKQRLEALERNPDMDKQAWQKKKDKGYYKKSGETYEQRKRYHAKYMREWRELNVSMGLCGYCGVNPAELGSKCDDCKEYQRKYLRNNHDKAVKNNKHERKRLREGILEAYGNKCACCGEKQQEFLAIDHINNDGAEHRRSIGGGGMMYRWLKKHGYPEGFQILCQNCNWGKRLYGICPHQFKSS